jgi:hypothetical protein
LHVRHSIVRRFSNLIEKLIEIVEQENQK